ncbi:MAG TPA: response regulator [Gaiellaceae bacterium]|nr:response regulator [Gaiellaceae bacterium]
MQHFSELTFLFTDIERSTGLIRKLGDRYCEVLDTSRAALRGAVAHHGGREVEARADEFVAVFDDPADAVAAAERAQRSLAVRSWPGGSPVRVRMGLNTGSVIEADNGFVGLEVNRTSRICTVAHGGQVLLSERTAELSGAAAVDLGRYELAGLAEPERILQLEIEGLPSQFPPLRNARRVDDGRLRVALADDSVLVREGIARVLDELGVDVVAQAGSGDELLAEVARTSPDVAVVDIRMPPSGSDEGLRAGKEILRRYPDVGVLLLSQALEPAYADELLESGGGGVGYLLKDRVADFDELGRALARIAEGGIAFDPTLQLASGA